MHPAFLVLVLAAAPVPRSTALLTSVSLQVPPPMAALMEATLRRELARTPGLRILSEADTQLGVDQARGAGWQCMGAAACLADLGRALAVEDVLAVNVDRVGAAWTLEAHRVRVDARAETGRGSARLMDDQKGWPAIVQRLLRSVDGGGAVLELACATPGVGAVLVDGEDLGTPQPSMRLGGLLAGDHVVRVVFAQAPPQERHVAMGADGTVRLRISSNGVAEEVEQAHAVREGAAGRSFPVVPVAGAGVLAGIAVLALAGAVGLAAGAAGLLGTLTRDAQGRAAARAGQSRALVELQLYGGLGMGAAALVALVLCAASLVGAAGAGVAAVVAWNSSAEGTP